MFTVILNFFHIQALASTLYMNLFVIPIPATVTCTKPELDLARTGAYVKVNNFHFPGLWIRICMDPYSFSLLDPNPDG